MRGRGIPVHPAPWFEAAKSPVAVFRQIAPPELQMRLMVFQESESAARNPAERQADTPPNKPVTGVSLASTCTPISNGSVCAVTS